MKDEKQRLTARLHILLKQLPYAEKFKEDMYADFGVTSSTELTEKQLNELIDRLEGKERKGLERSILTTLNKLGYIRNDKDNEPFGELNEFVKKHGKGKIVPGMNIEELRKLLQKLNIILKTGWNKGNAKGSIKKNVKSVPKPVKSNIATKTTLKPIYVFYNPNKPVS